MTVYCIDTSSLINLKRWRPRARNRAVWRRLEELVSADRLIAPNAVLVELKGRDDGLAQWAQAQRGMLKPHTSDHVSIVQKILERFPDLVDVNQKDDEADPFVVALAAYEKSQTLFPDEYIVVTEEVYRPGRSKIPHVCEAFEIKYRNLHQMFLDEGWAL